MDGMRPATIGMCLGTVGSVLFNSSMFDEHVQLCSTICSTDFNCFLGRKEENH